jgi:hypothetical protein
MLHCCFNRKLQNDLTPTQNKDRAILYPRTLLKLLRMYCLWELLYFVHVEILVNMFCLLILKNTDVDTCLIRFNTSKLIIYSQNVFVFLRKLKINSDDFPNQHYRVCLCSGETVCWQWTGHFTLVNFCASDGCELWSESQAMCLIIMRYSHHRFMLHCANVREVLQLEKSW